MTAEVPPAANWMRMACGSWVTVVGVDVGGTAVGGTLVGSSGVGEAVAEGTIAVGGADVFVASAATPVVAVGGRGEVVGGGLLDGSWHAVTISANSNSTTPQDNIFLFMVPSLGPKADISMTIFYIILCSTLPFFKVNWVQLSGQLQALYTRMAAWPSNGQLCSQIPQPMHTSRTTLGRSTVMYSPLTSST